MTKENFEIIIGYDVRIMWFDVKKQFKGRGANILLYMDIDALLSIDCMIWTSAFDQEGVYCFNSGQFLPINGPEIPYDVLSNDFSDNYWFNLKKLRTFISQHYSSIRKPAWVICFTLIRNNYLSKDLEYEFTTIDKMLTTINYSDWEFLGYDIADQYFISGLTHCQYPNYIKKNNYSDSFVHNLNKYHLFENIEIAQLFKSYCNYTVPSHAPFFVFGIYLVEKLDGDNSL